MQKCKLRIGGFSAPTSNGSDSTGKTENTASLSPDLEFGEFDDKSKYAGKYPKAAYLNAVMLAMHAKRRPWLVHQLEQVMGDIVKGDHSFKIAKKVLSK